MCEGKITYLPRYMIMFIKCTAILRGAIYDVDISALDFYGKKEKLENIEKVKKSHWRINKLEKSILQIDKSEKITYYSISDDRRRRLC